MSVFPLCTDPGCSSAGVEHGHLSMPDPCPHVTRIGYLRALLHVGSDNASLAAECQHIVAHVDSCDQRGG